MCLFLHRNRKDASIYIMKDVRKRFNSVNELKPSLYKLSFVNTTCEVLNFADVKFRKFGALTKNYEKARNYDMNKLFYF